MVSALSRMTRYLKQTAKYEAVLTDNTGNPQLNEYGTPQYASSVSVRCRKEPYKAKASTGYGAFVDYNTTYYLDEKVRPSVDDKLDGQLVKEVVEYVDGMGTLVGFEVHV